MKVVAGVTLAGWASLIVAVLFVGSVQLICLGILGSYLGRVYDEVKGRPIYVVQEHQSGLTGRAEARVSMPAETAAESAVPRGLS